MLAAQAGVGEPGIVDYCPACEGLMTESGTIDVF